MRRTSRFMPICLAAYCRTRPISTEPVAAGDTTTGTVVLPMPDFWKWNFALSGVVGPLLQALEVEAVGRVDRLVVGHDAATDHDRLDHLLAVEQVLQRQHEVGVVAGRVVEPHHEVGVGSCLGLEDGVLAGGDDAVDRAWV